MSEKYTSIFTRIAPLFRRKKNSRELTGHVEVAMPIILEPGARVFVQRNDKAENESHPSHFLVVICDKPGVASPPNAQPGEAPGADTYCDPPPF